MDATAARWLVCAGSGALLPIMAALVAAGCAAGAEWEPSPVRACAKAAQAGKVNIVVGALPGEDALDVASRLAGLTQGTVVLCAEGAAAVAAQAVRRGVTAAVEPGALARLFIDMVERPGGTFVDEGVHGRAAGASEVPGILPAAGVDAPARAVDLEGPAREGDPLGIGGPAAFPQDVVSREVVCEEAGPVVSGRPESTGGMRPAGCLPHIGVAEQLEEERACRLGALQVSPGTPAAPVVPVTAGCMPTVQPPASVAGLPIEAMPLVMSPVVDLPQVECRVAGEGEHVPTVCFASARGGVGKTSLAVMAALTLARDGLRVAIIDLDYQFGTCLGFLGASETYGLVDDGALPGRLRVDARTLARCRSTPEAGLAAFEFCHLPEQAELLAGASAQIVRAARAGSDIAVVDLPAGVGEAAAQVFDLADRCLLVTDQRAFALESLSVQQDLCVRMGVARTKLVTVINRCDPRHRDEGFLSRAQFGVQTPQTLRVVDGGTEVAQMLSLGSAGELLGMRNKFALSAADMAHALCSDLGCGVTRDAVPQASTAPLAAAPVREGLFGRGRKARREEPVPCPF